MTLVDGGRHELTLGSLVLSEGFPQRSVDGFTITTLGDDADFGNPESIDVTIPSQMLDGADERTVSWGNRELFFRVKFVAKDGVGLALGEAALLAELGRRNVLAWTPPAPGSPTTLFTVVNSRLEVAFNDVDELRVHRVYGVRLRALPFGRSVDVAVVPALSAGATPVSVTVDACDSLTGWSVRRGALSVVDGALQTRLPVFEGSRSVAGAAKSFFRALSETSLVRTGVVNMSGTPYLRVDARNFQTGGIPAASGPTQGMRVEADGVPLLFLGSEPSPIAGFTRHTFLCPDPSVAELVLTPLTSGTWQEGFPDSVSVAVQVAEVSRSNQLAGSGATGRQSLRSIRVEGSARTEGNLHVSSTQALGDVLVYTSPRLGSEGYVPDMMRWLTSEGGDDPTSVSGRRITGYGAWRAPLRFFPPGPYLVCAQLSSSYAGPREQTFEFGTSFGTANPTRLATLDGRFTPSTADYEVHPIGSIVLPVDDAPDVSSANLWVRRPAGTAGYLGELWLLHMGDDAAVTMINCGTGTPTVGGAASKVWINSPDLTNPNPRVWVGSTTDQSDARNPGAALSSLGRHKFPAGDNGLFVVTSNTRNPDISLTHPVNWHTNAAS